MGAVRKARYAGGPLLDYSQGGMPLMEKPIGLKKAMRRLLNIADAVSRSSRASLAEAVRLWGVSIYAYPNTKLVSVVLLLGTSSLEAYIWHLAIASGQGCLCDARYPPFSTNPHTFASAINEGNGGDILGTRIP